VADARPPDAELRARFFGAFASRPRPAADALVDTADPVDRDAVVTGLASHAVEELSAAEIGEVFEGRLGMLRPEALLYFMPALLYHALVHDDVLSVFTAELVGFLTRPERSEVVRAFDRLAKMPPSALVDRASIEALRAQQLEWFDSGAPVQRFEARFADVGDDEGRAILTFLEEVKARHGEDFPFGELDEAIGRHWSRFA
jgi:hypothetical protein